MKFELHWESEEERALVEAFFRSRTLDEPLYLSSQERFLRLDPRNITYGSTEAELPTTSADQSLPEQ